MLTKIKVVAQAPQGNQITSCQAGTTVWEVIWDHKLHQIMAVLNSRDTILQMFLTSSMAICREMSF